MLDTITNFAGRYKLGKSTRFLTEVINVQKVAHDRYSANTIVCILCTGLACAFEYA